MAALPRIRREQEGAVAAVVPVRRRPARGSGIIGSLEAVQERSLDELRDPAADRSMLLQLMETSFLLELSKLASAHLDLASYAHLVTDVLVQFLPVDACFLRVEVPELPAVRAAIGVSPAAEGQDSDLLLHPIVLDDVPVGMLGVQVVAGPAGSTDFFATVATHIASGLGSVVEAERLRRQAAFATAMRLASDLPEVDADHQIERLVAALAALPRATGARLCVELPSLGPPLQHRFGTFDGMRSEIAQNDIARGGRLFAEVAWSGAPLPPDVAMFQEAFDALVAAMVRVDQARQLREEVEIDPLTGVGNRRRAARSLAAALARAERTDEPVSVLAIDLDHFKAVNDELGHDAGDTVLQVFAEGLVSAVRGYDTVVRMGGEEFHVICPGLDMVGAKALALRLLAAAPSWCDGVLEGRGQTVSIGIAVYPDVTDRADDLLRKADGALYAAKAAGRNTFHVA